LNIATVFDAKGYNPVKGPTARIIGFFGPKGSASFGQYSKRRFVATPVPPRYSLNKLGLCST
jgi:hypothetical protein